MIYLSLPNSTLIKGKKSFKQIDYLTEVIEEREHSKFDFGKKTKLIHFDQNINFIFDQKIKKIIIKNIKNKKYSILSFQMASCYQNPILKNNIFYPSGKKIDPNKMIKNIGTNLRWLKKIINKNSKIAIENNNYFNTGAYEYITEPSFFNLIFKKYNIFMLFDFSHAKITSYNKKILFEKYLEQLDLSKIIQMHFSGNTIKNKKIYDTHFKPKKTDFNELKKILPKLKKLKYITIEYYKNINVLEDICQKLKKNIKNIV